MLFSVFYLVVFAAFGQENRLHDEIRQAKESNVYFDTAAFESAEANLQVLGNFINPNQSSIKIRRRCLFLLHQWHSTPCQFYFYVLNWEYSASSFESRSILFHGFLPKQNHRDTL